jgi:hypothetical protein
MAKKRLGNNPLGHLVSSRPPAIEEARELEAEAGSDATADDEFKRKTVHMRSQYVRLMKRIATLEDKDIKDVYDEAIKAYIQTKQDLIDRHAL